MTTMSTINMLSATTTMSVSVPRTKPNIVIEHMTPTNMLARRFAEPGVILRNAFAFVATWVPVVVVCVVCESDAKEKQVSECVWKTKQFRFG